MIIKFKLFESFEDKPRVGNYVIVFGDYFDKAIIDFFKTHIGKLIEINHEVDEYKYTVEFEEEIPLQNNNKMNFNEDEIIEWSPIKNFEITRAARKYNL